MKIISWNVNGLRAVWRKEEGWKALFALTPAIVCLQETKASPEQLTSGEAHMPGYKSFFSSSKIKKGYSGVATYTKLAAKDVAYGMGLPGPDDEGRILTTRFDDFTLLNVYFPNGGGGPHRLKYKMDFYDEFLKHINALREKGERVIFVGDVNTAHEEIDLARPKENEKNTGFLPEERAWLDEVVAAGWVDTFRHFYPSRAGVYSYWDMKTRARDRNVGWRIDYVFVDATLLSRVKRAFIVPEIYGSDHCPVGIDLDTTR